MRHSRLMGYNTIMDRAVLQKFEAIVSQYQKSIINFHYRFVGDKYEAENLAQDTFVKAYLKFDTLKEEQKLKSWLFSIARHVVIDFFRKNKHREIAFGNGMVEAMAETAAVDFQAQLDNDEISQELARCIDQLSAQDKVIIKLLYFEGFSYKEISRLLKINPNTLKSRLHRARTMLLETVQANVLLREVALQYQ